MYKPQWVGRKRNRQSTKVPAYSISRVFLMELPYHNTLDTCSNMSKNATNDKIQSSGRFTNLLFTFVLEPLGI